MYIPPPATTCEGPFQGEKGKSARKLLMPHRIFSCVPLVSKQPGSNTTATATNQSKSWDSKGGGES